MRLAYIAHPYNAQTAELRAANREAAKRWVEFAARHDYAPVATWITLTELWTEDDRDLGLEIDCAIATRCDELWLCGPRISVGMHVELERTMRAGRLVRRFTDFAQAERDIEAARAQMTKRYEP